MLGGAVIGGLAGAAGSGLSALGASPWTAGAVAGGAVGSDISTALSGGSIGDIGLSMLVGGALAYGTYELSSYVAYKQAGVEVNGQKISYRQFSAMQADYQRARFWHKEYGGILMKGGSTVKVPNGNRYKYNIDFNGSYTDKLDIKNLLGWYHVHWNANNVFSGLYDSAGNQIMTADGASPEDLANIRNKSTEEFTVQALLVDRLSVSNYTMYGVNLNWGSAMLRYFPFYSWLNKR